MHKLKRWLAKFKMSQAAFAREMDIDPSLVSHWLRGTRKPGRNMLKELSAITGIDIKDLL